MTASAMHEPPVEETPVAEAAVAEAADVLSPEAPAADPRPEWIRALVTPFGDGAEREDPRYGDAFMLIKQEIDKLSGNDYDEVIRLARKVLAEEGKDLRVAGYLLLALSYVSGVEGFRDGLWIYEGLLRECGEELFPTKAGARAAALRWLNHAKLQAYVTEQGDNASHETLQQIATAIENINDAIAALLGDSEDEPPRFTLLDDWTAERLKQTAPKEAPPAEAKNDAPSESPGTARERAAASAQTFPADGAELTEAERLRHGQSLCRIFLEAGDAVRAVSLARALRWSTLRLPPHEGGRTRLPAPRAAGLAAIRNALAGNDPKAALAQSEAMLFEPSGQFLLDLAWLSHEAAVALGDDELAATLERQTGLLLGRLDGVMDLQYEDGTPFASGEARPWLEQCIPRGEGGGVGLQGRLDEELNTLIDAARETARKQGLPEALNLFSGYGAYTERQRFLMRMAMAGLCLEHGRVDIAWPVIEELWDTAEARHLAWWDVDLVITLARYARSALRSLLGQAEEGRRVELERRLEAIHQTVCRIDMQQALAMN